MARIGLYGGTFDPPHIGHLLIAEETRLQLELDEIWFIVAATPPHKEGTSKSEDRVEMVREATKDNPYFKVCTIELEREGKSYTIDTIRTLKQRYPNEGFYFLLGADMIEYLPKWYKIDELIDEIQFIGMKRSGYSVKTTYPVEIVDIPIFDVSSTLLRERIYKNQSVRYYINQSVLKYIKEHRMYE